MNSHRPRHLRQSGNRFLHRLGLHHHQVGQLVDDDHDVGKRPLALAVGIEKVEG